MGSPACKIGVPMLDFALFAVRFVRLATGAPVSPPSLDPLEEELPGVTGPSSKPSPLSGFLGAECSNRSPLGHESPVWPTCSLGGCGALRHETTVLFLESSVGFCSLWCSGRTAAITDSVFLLFFSPFSS